MAINVLYRGPLQRSRLSFLTESMAQAYGPVKLYWLSPRQLTKELVIHFQEFLTTTPWITDWELMDGLTGALPITVGQLRRAIKRRDEPIAAIGLTAAPYAALIAQGKSTWCFNSIPEEKLFHSRGLLNKLYVEFLWSMTRWAAQRHAPDLVVNVSEPMSEYVQKRGKFRRVFAAPLCVNTATFTPQKSTTRTYMTYLGTGAPWQGIDDLAKIWAALYQLDNNLRFRVISRDERTKQLAQGIPEYAIEFTPAETPQAVAQYLWEAEAGFLIREPDLLNRIAVPVKFAEYLAAGAYVVASDLGWQPGRIIQKTGCGVLVEPTLSPQAAAQKILQFRHAQGTRIGMAQQCQAASIMLDRRTWVTQLANALPQA